MVNIITRGTLSGVPLNVLSSIYICTAESIGKVHINLHHRKYWESTYISAPKKVLGKYTYICTAVSIGESTYISAPQKVLGKVHIYLHRS